MESTATGSPWQAALARAIAKAGGKTALARTLNVASHNVIAHWEKNGIPAKYCPDIEAATGVPCEELSPDVNWSVLRSKKARAE